MKKVFTKEIIIGLITILSLVILYIGLNHLKGANVFKPANHYYVRMPRVNELQLSSPVYVDGFKVGLVNTIDFGYESGGNIVVQISLDKKMKVETGSYLELKSGLTSGAYLDIYLNKYVSDYHQPGDTLTGISKPGMMDKISAEMLPQIESILPRLDSILQGIQVIVNHPALTQTLDNLSSTTANLEKSTLQLNKMISKDISPILSNLNQVSTDFTIVSQNLKTLDLNTTVNLANQTLSNIDLLTGRLNNKNSSLGLLMNDRSLYDNLDSTALNASRLLFDIQKHPKRYIHFSVFGKRN
ncbi:mammalian cell entry protein [Bacteroidia bacterium]|nr:mammalian cell entry protein [Bacteroidia bacterium]